MRHENTNTGDEMQEVRSQVDSPQGRDQVLPQVPFSLVGSGQGSKMKNRVRVANYRDFPIKFKSPNGGMIPDIRGLRFGRLIVLEYAGMSRGGKSKWKCICDCGTEKVTELISLSSGGTTSCGCRMKETVSMIGKLNKGRKPSNRLPYGEASFNAILYNYRAHAKRLNLPLELSVDQIRALTKKDCFYCGTKPYRKMLGHNSQEPYIYNGIDRKDSALGYTIKNCVACCDSCNKAKGTMRLRVFAELVERIHIHWASRYVQDVSQKPLFSENDCSTISPPVLENHSSPHNEQGNSHPCPADEPGSASNAPST